MSLTGDARTAPSRPSRQAVKRRRWAKLVGAFALALLVGAATYALTYRVLVVVSTPAVVTSAAPSMPGGGTATAAVTTRPVLLPS